MTLLRQRKRKVDDELLTLQKKEAKSLKQKKTRNSQIKEAKNRLDGKQLNSSQHTLDEVLDKGQALNAEEVLEDSAEISKESEVNSEVVSDVEEKKNVAPAESFL